jgi:hypothetical protein
VTTLDASGTIATAKAVPAIGKPFLQPFEGPASQHFRLGRLLHQHIDRGRCSQIDRIGEIRGICG